MSKQVQKNASTSGNKSKQKGNKIPNTPKAVVQKKDLLDTLDNFFVKKEKLFLFIGLGATLLFSILLFDIKVSPGGDDSAYIARAYEVVHGFVFPSFQGPLYPFALSIFVWMAGINLIVLKSFSLLCMFFSLYLFYKTCSGRMPQVIATISFILLSINYSLLYYSSQTYSEAFYLLLQSIFFWYIAKKFLTETNEKNPVYQYLMLGLLLFLLTLTRNIAFAAIAAVIGYFILNKKWKSVAFSLGGFIIFYFLFAGVKRLVWGDMSAQISSQASSILYKDFYNPSMGTEDAMGLINRFIANANQFFSRHVFNFVGLRIDILEPNMLLMFFVWGLLGLAFYWGLKKNKLLLLTTLYTLTMCSASFFALQKEWNQSRMIIIYLPFFLLVFFSGLYYSTKTKKFKAFQFLVPLMAVILFFSTLTVTLQFVKQQKEILSHNLEGDLLYGLTPDWKNYILMSKWAAVNTPPEYLTAVRKAEISFIYGERKFFGITKVPTITPDSLLKSLSESLVYVGIEMNKFMQTSIYGDSTFRSNLIGFVNGRLEFGGKTDDNTVVGVFGFKPSDFASWEPAIKQTGAFYDKNIKTWIKSLSTSKSEFAITMPDLLLQQLKKGKVKYMLIASLRANPNERTENIITTLHRYVYFIQLKYPNKFTLVHAIGTDEKAELLQIN